MKRTLAFLLYRSALLVGLPFIVLYLAWRSLRDRAYLHGLPERLGILGPALRQTSPGAIWLHAVSVGEVLAAVGLIKELKRRQPATPVVVSVTTLAGHELAGRRLAGLADAVFFTPLDYVACVRRVLRQVRPSIMVVLETEIWPHLWREARRSGASLLVVNGRISDRAWPRYRRLRWFFSAVLAEASTILTQSEISQQRFLELGAVAANTRSGGNLKFDFGATVQAPPESITRLLEQIRPKSVWIAASTMTASGAASGVGDCDEHEAVLDAFAALQERHPRTLLVLAPRKPEMFDEVAERLGGRGIRFVRRSRLSNSVDLQLPGVLLLDSIGELSSLFSLASVVFMGGTLANRGGHNVLEPAFFGKAVISGPHLENFPEIAHSFRTGNALFEIAGAGELSAAVERLLEDEALRDGIASRARALASSGSGVTVEAAEEVERLCDVAIAAPLPNLAARLLFGIPAWLWSKGSVWNRARLMSRQRKLAAPVISVGSLSMGGAGKTPFVLALAKLLQQRGIATAFLTRGYRRAESRPVTIVEAGAGVPSSVTGDEAQILVRSGLGPVGIGADRCRAGSQLWDSHRPGAYLLDDGFQHAGLHRDADIVLVDTLDPFGGGHCFPLGKLREPVETLRHADVIILSRVQPGRRYTAIVDEIRRHNAEAPIFRAATVARSWVNARTGERTPAECPAFQAPFAFCGLGNPGSFWRTLAALGIETIGRVAFRDHHRYRPAELRDLGAAAQAAGARSLVTTEKDAMNLDAEAVAAALPLPVFWLEIETVIEDGEGLTDFLLERLSRAASGLASIPFT